jgi:hypothetical protein
VAIKVIFILREDAAETPGAEDEHPIEDFPTKTADPPFHDRICTGRQDWSLDDPYSFAGEDRVEHAGEFAVSVADQEFELRHMLAEVHEQVTGLLGNPVCGGMCGGAEDDVR